MKKLLSLMALFVISLLTVSMVSATSEASTLGDLKMVDVKVEVNDEEMSNTPLTVERGEEFEVNVDFEISGDGNGNEVKDDAKNIEAEAQLLGYDKKDAEDSAVVKKVTYGTKGTGVTLKLTVPNDFVYKDATLRVRVSGGANEADLTVDYKLYVEST